MPVLYRLDYVLYLPTFCPSPSYITSSWDHHSISLASPLCVLICHLSLLPSAFIRTHVYMYSTYIPTILHISADSVHIRFYLRKLSLPTELLLLELAHSNSKEYLELTFEII